MNFMLNRFYLFLVRTFFCGFLGIWELWNIYWNFPSLVGGTLFGARAVQKTSREKVAGSIAAARPCNTFCLMLMYDAYEEDQKDDKDDNGD